MLPDPDDESEKQGFNPYAPIDSAGLTPLPKPLPGEFSGAQLAWNTFALISLSGGIFGFGFVIIAAIISLASEAKDAQAFLSLLVIVFPGVFAALIGICLAALGAMVVVPIAYLVTKVAGARREYYWSGTRVRVFGATCGFLTGWMCVACFALVIFEFWPIVAGLVPGIVGCIATTLMLHSTAKQADRILSQRFDEPSFSEREIDPLSTIRRQEL